MIWEWARGWLARTPSTGMRVQCAPLLLPFMSQSLLAHRSRRPPPRERMWNEAPRVSSPAPWHSCLQGFGGDGFKTLPLGITHYYITADLPKRTGLRVPGSRFQACPPVFQLRKLCGYHHQCLKRRGRLRLGSWWGNVCHDMGKKSKAGAPKILSHFLQPCQELHFFQ